MPQKQRNTPLTVAEAQERLQANGLKLTHENYSYVATSTEVTVSCAAHHTMTRKYGVIRKRGCPQCKAPFGERLLTALLRHYVVGPDDWRAKTVIGLDPRNPARKFFYDVASDSRQIALENHSEYHKQGATVRRLQQGMSNEERLRCDSLKVPEDAGGKHSTGPLAGWIVGVVWFEAARVAKLGAGSTNGTYLPKVIAEFKALASRIGLVLRSDGVEIDAVRVFQELARNPLSTVSPNFELVGEWHGRTREHTWRHIHCKSEFKAPLLELETAVSPDTGCPFCDRKGNPGKWLDFLDKLKSFNYEYAGGSRLLIRTEHATVQLKCLTHPQATVAPFTRSKLYQWMASLDPNSTVSMFPPCSKCTEEHTKNISLSIENRINIKRLKLNERLNFLGFELLTFRPSTVRDKLTGKTLAQKNSVKCKSCNHEWETVVTVALAKAEKRGVIGCPSCNPLKKGPKPKAKEGSVGL